MMTSPQLPASNVRVKRAAQFAELRRTLVGTAITVVLLMCVVVLPAHLA